MRRRWDARRRSAGQGDSGFTLIEITVSIMVIAIGLLGLMGVQVRSLSTIALAGQRQAASQLANRAMEQLRALPYGTVTGGMVCTDLTTVSSDPNYDPNISIAAAASGCAVTFRPTYDSTISEPVVTQTGAQVAPLAPHRQTTMVGSTSYTVRSYVTRVNPDPTVDAGYWLTVISTWSSAATRGETKSLATRSQLYSPQGCLALTTHPFSGPCQAFFYTDAGVSGGGLTVASTRAGLPLLDGLDAVGASATLLDLSTRLQSEQVLSAQSQTVTAGGTLTHLSGAVDRNGGATGSSVADTDPSSGAVRSPTSVTPVSTTGVSALVSNGGGNRFSLLPDSSGTGTALSSMAAAGSPLCADDSGTAQINLQACTSGSTTAGSLTSSTVQLLGTGARTMTLADLGVTSTPSRAWGGRFIVGTGTHCASTTGIGCVGAGVQRAFGTAHVGGLLPPTSVGDKILGGSGSDVTSLFGSTSAPTPLVTLSSYVDKAQAESGIAPGSPTATRGGTLSYWNGVGFASVNLATAGTQTYTVGTAQGSYGTTSVAVNGTVTVTAPSTTPTGSAPCATAACVLRATGGSVVVSLTYTVSNGPVVTGGFTVSLDLGTALAQTTYKGAPSA